MIYDKVAAVLLTLDGYEAPDYFTSYDGPVCYSPYCDQAQNLVIYTTEDIAKEFLLACKKHAFATGYVPKRWKEYP